MSRENVFRASARYYDLEDQPLVRDDIPFYVERAAESEGPVLELACGTGRVSIPLVVEGHEVHGVDLSHEMLAVLEEKAASLVPEIRDRLTVEHGDMRDIALPRRFGLIILPYRSFQGLTSLEDRRRCLSVIRSHLAPGGRVILNAFRPFTELDRSWVQPEATDWVKVDPATGRSVRRTHVRRAIDVERQIIFVDVYYHLTHENGTVQTIHDPLRLGYFYEEQLRELLVENGFRIVEELGYYDGRPIGEGPELIFVCE